MTKLGPVDLSVIGPDNRTVPLQRGPIIVGSHYRDGWKYRTSEALVIPTSARWRGINELSGKRGRVSCYPNGNVWVSENFGWDGPSGPAFDTRDFMRASLVHDVFYWMMREGKLRPWFRPTADRVMRELAREDGMPWIRAWWAWKGVRLGARGAAKRGASTRL